MVRRAFDCIEEGVYGSWLCIKNATVEGRYGTVEVKQGTRFNQGCVFAGFDDFPSYLASVSIDVPKTG